MFDSELKPPATDVPLSEELPAGEWETVQLHGCWKNGQSAGGSRNFPSFHINPCFPLSIPAGSGKSSVKVTLRQHCQDSKCRPIGFHIFQVRCLVGLIARLPRVKRGPSGTSVLLAHGEGRAASRRNTGWSCEVVPVEDTE